MKTCFPVGEPGLQADWEQKEGWAQGTALLRGSWEMEEREGSLASPRARGSAQGFE